MGGFSNNYYKLTIEPDTSRQDMVGAPGGHYFLDMISLVIGEVQVLQ